MHPGTERKIKVPIEAFFREPLLLGRLNPANASSGREFELLNTRFRADFAFRTNVGGWFFVEDDDAQRCLSNFIKYWKWVESQPRHIPFSLVHIVGPPGVGQQQLLNFVSEKVERHLPNFRFKLVETRSWETDVWFNAFRNAVFSLPPFREP